MEQYTMTRKEELVSIYWDFYKEVYNVRPRWVDFDSCTEADLESMLDRLGEESKAVFAQQAEADRAAVARFEALVDATIASGAKDRVTALRWIMEGSTCGNDWDFLCWEHGLPYAYFRRSVDAQLV